MLRVVFVANLRLVRRQPGHPLRGVPTRYRVVQELCALRRERLVAYDRRRVYRWSVAPRLFIRRHLIRIQLAVRHFGVRGAFLAALIALLDDEGRRLVPSARLDQGRHPWLVDAHFVPFRSHWVSEEDEFLQFFVLLCLGRI